MKQFSLKAHSEILKRAKNLIRYTKRVLKGFSYAPEYFECYFDKCHFSLKDCIQLKTSINKTNKTILSIGSLLMYVSKRKIEMVPNLFRYRYRFNYHPYTYTYVYVYIVYQSRNLVGAIERRRDATYMFSSQFSRCCFSYIYTIRKI